MISGAAIGIGAGAVVAGSGLGTGGVSAKMRAVSGRTFWVDEFGGASNRYNRVTEVHPAYFRLTGRMYVSWPNYYIANTATNGGGKETGTGGTATFEGAYITYYDATTGLPVVKYFKDATLNTQVMVAADGEDVVGYVDVDIMGGSHFTFDLAADFAGGMPFMQNVADRANGDVFQFGTSPISLATVPTNSAFVTNAWYGACRIRMLSAVPTWGIIGDSIDRGYLDLANDLWGAQGCWGRFLGKRVPTLNASRSGERGIDFQTAANNPKRIAALIADCDYLAIGLGLNDLYFNSSTAAQVDGYNTAIEALIGKTVTIRRSLPPVINYPANTVNNAAGEARRSTYNSSYVRTKPRYYDPAITVESSGTPGTFANIAYVNTDGTHPTNTGNDASIGNASALALVSAYAIPATLTFQPWDISNILPATVATWLHPADYVLGSWPARVGASAVQGTGANQPAVGASGGADLTATKWLTSTLSASMEECYLAATCKFTVGTGNQTIAGSSGTGRQFRNSASTVLTLNKQGAAQRGAATVTPNVGVGSFQITDLRDSAVENIWFGLNGKTYVTGNTGASQPYVAGTTTLYGRTSGGGETMAGTLFEVVALNALPNLALVTKIQGRLAWRAGVQASLDASHPYRTVEPTL